MEKGDPLSTHINYIFTFFIRANGFFGYMMMIGCFYFPILIHSFRIDGILDSLFLSILIGVFLVYLIIWFQLLTHPDNVKCPNCKFTRVDNTILRKQNLGYSSTIYSKVKTFIYYRICTTYKCIKCGYTFNKECCRSLESYQKVHNS